MEFAIVQHPLERLPRPQHLDVELDAFRLDPPVDQRPGAVIIPACERQLEGSHKRWPSMGRVESRNDIESRNNKEPRRGGAKSWEESIRETATTYPRQQP